MAIEPYADNFIPVIPTDEFEHSPDKPFCSDPACDCHEDQDAIGLVAQYVDRGLMTPQEAADFVGGRTI
jgi:hypothetical protein